MKHRRKKKKKNTFTFLLCNDNTYSANSLTIGKSILEIKEPPKHSELDIVGKIEITRENLPISLIAKAGAEDWANAHQAAEETGLEYEFIFPADKRALTASQENVKRTYEENEQKEK